MKLKNIFIGLFAVLGLSLATSCTEDSLKTLSDIKVDKSFINFGKDGGSDCLSLTTAGDWKMIINWNKVKTGKKDDAGKDIYTDDVWFEVDKTEGAKASEEKITFTALKEQPAFKSVEAEIICNGQTQILKITQGEDIPTAVTMKELIDDDVVGKQYRLDNVVCVKITKPQYGGMVITDGLGNEVVIYSWKNKGDFAGLAPGYKFNMKGTWSSHHNFENAELLSTPIPPLMDVFRDAATVNNEGLEKVGDSAELLSVRVLQYDGDLTVSFDQDWITVKNVRKGTFEDLTEDQKKEYENAIDPSKLKGFGVVYQFAVQPYHEKNLRNAVITFNCSKGKNESEAKVNVTQFGDIPEPVKVSDVEPDPFVRVQGKVVAFTSYDFILWDGTGCVLIHTAKGQPTQKLGGMTDVTGKSAIFKKGLQIEAQIYIDSKSKAISDPKAVEYKDADFKQLLNADQVPVKRITVTGKLVYGQYVNLTPTGADGYSISVRISKKADDLKKEFGDANVTIDGYLYQLDKTTFNVAVNSIKKAE